MSIPLPVTVTVPFQENALEPVSSRRMRIFKRHLVESLRDLRKEPHPDTLIQQITPAPEGFAGTVMLAGCTQCQGFCCQQGGEHAYLDDRSMARVRRNHPGLDARAVIRLYTDAIPPLAYAGSCVFHGAAGCTLARPLRAELCNSYFCTGLLDFLNKPDKPAAVVVVASRNGRGQKSEVLRDPD